jgi:hypothetical protein
MFACRTQTHQKACDNVRCPPGEPYGACRSREVAPHRADPDRPGSVHTAHPSPVGGSGCCTRFGARTRVRMRTASFVAFTGHTSGQKAMPDEAAMGLSRKDESERPSRGNLFLRSDECRAACRRLVLVSVTISQPLTSFDRQPLSAATLGASRSLRSSVPSSSLMSTNSVLSSTTSRCDEVACRTAGRSRLAPHRSRRTLPARPASRREHEVLR